MVYTRESSRKLNKHNNKRQDIDTVTSKKYWIVLTNKGRLAYNDDGSIVMFSRRRDALEFLVSKPEYLKIEKLDVIITR